MVDQVILKKPEEAPKKLSKVEAMKKWEAQKERDLELVTGIFEYKEEGKRGQTLRFNFGKYVDTFKQYSLKDGARCRIPRIVAQHLNNGCYYSEYQHVGSEFAKAVDSNTVTGQEDTYARMYAIKKIHRTAFRSLEYMDDDLYPKNELTEIVYR